MIFITAKFKIKPEYADQWPQISAEFTGACRNEPGCLWFDWSRSVDDPEEYVLVEAFRDGDAGAAHVNSDHFKKAQQTLPRQPYAADPKDLSSLTQRASEFNRGFWDLLAKPGAYTDPVTAGRITTQPVFTAPAAIPVLPWK